MENVGHSKDITYILHYYSCKRVKGYKYFYYTAGFERSAPDFIKMYIRVVKNLL